MKLTLITSGLVAFSVLSPSSATPIPTPHSSHLSARDELYLNAPSHHKQPPHLPLISAETSKELKHSVEKLNSFFEEDRINIGEACSPDRGLQHICVGDKVAFCGKESGTWDLDRDCGVTGLRCTAVARMEFVEPERGWRVDVQCTASGMH